MEEKVFITENKNLTIRMKDEGETVSLIWEGKCTLLYPSGFLNPIFDEALSLNKKIIMDFCSLDYITSSSFAPIIKLLNEVKAGTLEIELVYDSDSDWQEHNFSALTLFCTEDGRIRVSGISSR